MNSFSADRATCSHPEDRLRVIHDPDNARLHALCMLCGTEFRSHEPDNPHPVPLPEHVRGAMYAAVPGLVIGDESDLFLARAEGRTLEAGHRFGNRTTPWPVGCEVTMHSGEPFVRLRMTVDLGEQVREVLRHEPESVLSFPDGQIHQFVHSDVDFAMLPGQHAVALTARFAATPQAYDLEAWYQEAYFVAALTTRNGHTVLPGPDDLPAGTHTLVLLMMMDNITGLIAGFRRISMPAAMFNKLRAIIAAQGSEPRHIELGLAEIDTWQKRYPTEDLLFNDAPLTWRGGTDQPAPR